MNEEKKDLQYYQDRPDEYIVTENNAVLRRGQAGIIAKFPGKGTITPETSQEFHKRRKIITAKSILRGLIRGTGEEPPEGNDFDELLATALDASEIYMAHQGRTFLKSENLRAMGETNPVRYLDRVFSLLDADTPADLGSPRAHLVILLAQLAERRQILEGEVIDPGSDRGIKITKGD